MANGLFDLLRKRHAGGDAVAAGAARHFDFSDYVIGPAPYVHVAHLPAQNAAGLASRPSSGGGGAGGFSFIGGDALHTSRGPVVVFGGGGGGVAPGAQAPAPPPAPAFSFSSFALPSFSAQDAAAAMPADAALAPPVGPVGTVVAASGTGSVFTGGAPGGVITGDPEHNAFVMGLSDVDPFAVTSSQYPLDPAIAAAMAAGAGQPQPFTAASAPAPIAAVAPEPTPAPVRGGTAIAV